MKKTCPVVGISGWSGSGKTTLIEKIIPLLLKKGIRVCLIKHSSHLSLDRPESDSDRIYNTGVDILVHDGRQSLYRSHESFDLFSLLEGIPGEYDLFLVEGHKKAPIPKIWMGEMDPSAAGEIIAHFPYRQGDPEKALASILTVTTGAVT